MHSVHHEAFIPYFDLCPDSGDIAPSADDKAPYGLNRVLVHKLWITQNLRTPTAASLWFFMAHRPSKEVSEYLDHGPQLKKIKLREPPAKYDSFSSPYSVRVWQSLVDLSIDTYVEDLFIAQDKGNFSKIFLIFSKL